MFITGPSSKKRVLFFISGPVPTAAQMAIADSLTSSRRIVSFRNAQAVTKEASPERSDYICGNIPPQYLVTTKSFKPAQVIDLEQPELAFTSEPVPAVPAMAAVASPEVPSATPASDAPPAEITAAAAAPIVAPPPPPPPPATEPVVKTGKKKK